MYDAYKARKIIRSRDISYAFTNGLANVWYSVKGYEYFCFFCHINASQKMRDEIAFFVYFTFKGEFVCLFDLACFFGEVIADGS